MCGAGGPAGTPGLDAGYLTGWIPTRYDEIVSSNDNLDDVGAPPEGDQDEINRARRVGGVRSPVSDAVHFKQGDRVLVGWSLNLSRGGLRVILEETVEVGEEFEITLGEDEEPRPGRIVWAREEKGGAIVGVSFLDTDGSVPPPPHLLPQDEDTLDDPGDG
jgi:hypothetical protein